MNYVQIDWYYKMLNFISVVTLSIDSCSTNYDLFFLPVVISATGLLGLVQLEACKLKLLINYEVRVVKSWLTMLDALLADIILKTGPVSTQ